MNRATYGAARNELITRITEVLDADTRVGAAWLAGSIGRGEADEWSDIDLCIAVHDERVTEFWEDRLRFYNRVGRPVLLQPEMPANASMAGGRFQLVVFDGPIEVDICVGSVGGAQRYPATHVLFERVGIPVAIEPSLTPEERLGQAEWWLTFFWAMAPIAVKYAGRGETRSAASQVDLLTQSLIALRRLVEQPEGPRPWNPTSNRPLEASIDARLPKLGRTIDPSGALDVFDGLVDQVESLHSTLDSLGAAIPTEMPAQVRRLSSVAATEIASGQAGPSRKYR